MAVIGAVVVAPFVKAPLDVADLLLGGVLVADDADPAVAFRRHGDRLRRAGQIVDAPGGADPGRGLGASAPRPRGVARAARRSAGRAPPPWRSTRRAGVVGRRGQEAVAGLRRRQAGRDHRGSAIALRPPRRHIPPASPWRRPPRGRSAMKATTAKVFDANAISKALNSGLTHFGAGLGVRIGEKHSRAKRACACLWVCSPLASAPILGDAVWRSRR